MSAAVLGRFVERYGPSKSGMFAAAFWGTGLIVASLGVKLGILKIVWLGYGVLGGIGLGVGYITPVSTLVKWFPDRRGLATGSAIMGFGFGAAIGAPVFNYIMSSVTASKLDIPSAEYLAGMSSYNSAKAILKDIHVNNKSFIDYDMDQLFGAIKSGNTAEILSMLPEKRAIDAKSELDGLNTALNNPSLASFWRMKDSEQFASGISITFLVAGLAYLIIMAAAASSYEG
jgi:MFS family permease